MIILYAKDETAFTDNGICALNPTICDVNEIAGGKYELEMEHPIDGKGKLLAEEMLIRAPVPPMTIPEITLPEVKLWVTLRQTNLYSKLPVTSYPPAVSADIRAVRRNPSGYGWRAERYYNYGDLCVFGQYIYRAKRAHCCARPDNNPMMWGRAAPLTEAAPTYNAGTIAEILAAGETVFKIADYSAEWIRVRSLRGITGYADREDCEETVASQSGEVIPEQTITEQVFRICRVESEEDRHIVKVTARHISYDFQGNSLYNCKIQEADPMTAIAILQGALMIEDDRRIASDITGKKVSEDWSFKNPVNALLDPTGGLVRALSARLIRNNRDFYLLGSGDAHQGITISYGVNLRGVKWTRNVENVITRVVPRCSDQSDGYLYLTDGGPIINGEVHNEGEIWVDSPIADQYAFTRIEVLDCKYTVGEKYQKPDGTTETRTEESCRALMKADALKRFIGDAADGVDLTLDVEFILMGDTEEYRQYRNLQRVNLYDIITVKTGITGITATAQVNEYRYDSIRKRFKSVKLGTVNSFQRRVPGYRVVNQSITYDKLAPDLVNRIRSVNVQSSTSEGYAPGGEGEASVVTEVIDRLDSTSATAALSANMGRVLNESKAERKIYTSKSAFPATGAANVLYIAADSETLYYWDGNDYIEIGGSGGGSYTLPLASNGIRGGVQVGYTQSGKNYPVQLSSEKMYVNVPWENTTYSNMTGASASAAGAAGLVPAPAAGKNGQFLRGDATWQKVFVPYSDAEDCNALTEPGLYRINGNTTQNKPFGWGNLLHLVTSNGVVTQIGVEQINHNLYFRTYENGAWSAWQKVVRTGDVMGGASSSEAGSSGLVPAPASGKQAAFLRGDGTWQTPPGTYSLPLAANGTRGGVQIGYTQSGKNYPVQLSSEKMYVNVPWTDHYNWTDIVGRPAVVNGLNSSSTTDVLSAYQGLVLKNMITEESVFYTGIVDVTNGRSLSVSDNVDNLIFMQIMFSIANPATSTSKGMLLLPRYGSSNNAWYSLCVGGVTGGIRMNASGQTVEILGTSGFTTLYLTTIFGIMVRNATT